MLLPTNGSAAAIWSVALLSGLLAVSGAQAQEHSMDMDAGGRLGDYSMMRDSSGTAWQPDAAVMNGMHGHLGPWATMLHGYVYGVFDHQGATRGDQQTFSESMLMVVAQRTAGKSRLAFKAMLSLDPLMGKRGYPLLLQTGESADGVTPLVDRQHPHDLLMELALTGSTPLSANASAFVYAAYPGEPALGPPTFMHRFSAMANPEAPIAHHWLDSTHTSYGVLTGGVVLGAWKAEASAFNGREPDQFRWNFDPIRLGSYTARLSWNPKQALALQLSYGAIRSPEALAPEVNQQRYTVSAVVDHQLSFGRWQGTFAWGQNRQSSGATSNALLFETALQHLRHTLFARAENADKNELLLAGPLRGQSFNVSKISIGYLFDFNIARHLSLGVGALVSGYSLPAAIQGEYGSHPNSYMLFTRLNLN